MTRDLLDNKRYEQLAELNRRELDVTADEKYFRNMLIRQLQKGTPARDLDRLFLQLKILEDSIEMYQQNRKAITNE